MRRSMRATIHPRARITPGRQEIGNVGQHLVDHALNRLKQPAQIERTQDRGQKQQECQPVDRLADRVGERQHFTVRVGGGADTLVELDRGQSAMGEKPATAARRSMPTPPAAPAR